MLLIAHMAEGRFLRMLLMANILCVMNLNSNMSFYIESEILVLAAFLSSISSFSYYQVSFMTTEILFWTLASYFFYMETFQVYVIKMLPKLRKKF